MLRNTSVISISLPVKIMALLEQVTRQTTKTRSEVIKDLLITYYQDKSWQQIFAWGKNTKEKFNITSEKDILKVIND